MGGQSATALAVPFVRPSTDARGRLLGHSCGMQPTVGIKKGIGVVQQNHKVQMRHNFETRENSTRQKKKKKKKKKTPTMVIAHVFLCK
jgi:hypothetical protein